jgi:flavodoxin
VQHRLHRHDRLHPVKAAILVESLTGNTWKAAEKTADLLSQERWTITGLSKVRQPDLPSIQEAELILVGTWVHGAFLFAQAPWAVNTISNLPALSGKKAAAFCTFALDPGSSVDRLIRAVGDTGAYVIGGLAMSRSKLDQHSAQFAERLVDAVAEA